MFTRLPGAIARAILVVMMIVTPSMMIPTLGNDGAQIVALMALLAALFTLVEYSASSPSLIEFRGAPPFNRLRFGALFATVLTLSVVFLDPDQANTITRFF